METADRKRKSGDPCVGSPLSVDRIKWPIYDRLRKGLLNLTSALPTPFAPNSCFALPFALGTRLLVKAPLAELRIETRALHFAFEATECPFKALAVLNRYFQRTTAPLRTTETENSSKKKKIVATAASGKSLFAV